MSLGAVVRFWQAVREDEYLKRELGFLREENLDLQTPAVAERVNAIAAQAGFEVSPEELRTEDIIRQFWMKTETEQDLQADIVRADRLPYSEGMALIHSAALKLGYKASLGDFLDVSRARKQILEAGGADGQPLGESQLSAVSGGAYHFREYSEADPGYPKHRHASRYY